MDSKIRPDILTKIRQTPLLSHSAMRLMELVGDEDHGLQDVVRVVECDSVLTANVLKVVNSAALGLRTTIETVNRAVMYLGEKMVVGIALSTSADQVYHGALGGYESLRGDLWKHSLLTAIAARQLAEYAKKEVSPGLAFTAGILHDIGKSILSEFLKGQPREMLKRIDSGQARDYLKAEEEMLGTNHGQIGGALASHWNLPETLREVIQYHHEPAKAEKSCLHLTYVVHLSDIVAMMGGLGTGADAMAYNLDANYPFYIDIDRKSLEKLMMGAIIEFEKTEAMLFGQGKGN